MDGWAINTNCPNHQIAGMRRRSVIQYQVGSYTVMNKSKSRTLRLFYTVFRGLLSASAAAFAMFAATQSIAQEVGAGPEVIEEIVVVGIRGGLQRSLVNKRGSISIVDGISADDISDFPGYNITEEIGRLPGVAITREDGEGQQITVRGLAAEFTRVTINGQTVTSGNAGREVDFDVFASEMFSAVTITKTATASMVEGGLAATVDLRTPRPLDLDDQIFRVSAEISSNDLREDADPRFAAMGSKVFADGRFGVAVTAAYSETGLRQDTSQPWRYTFRADTVAGGAHDVNGDGIPDSELVGVVNPNLPRNVLNTRTRERLGITASFQYRPSDNLEFSLDYLHAETEEDRNRYTIDGNLQAEGGIWPSLIGGAVVENGVLVAGTFANVNQRSEELIKINDEETDLITAEVDWQISDDWNAFFKLSRSDASKTTWEEAYLVQGNGTFRYELLQNGRFFTFPTSIDHLDATQFFLAQTLVKPNKVNDEEDSFHFDLTRDFMDSSVTRLSAGVYGSERDADLTKWETRFNPKRFLPADPGTLFDISAADIMGTLPATDVFIGFDNVPAGVVTDWLIVDVDLVGDSRFFNQDATPDADGFVFRTISTTTENFGQRSGQTVLTPNLQQTASWAVEEKTFSGYVEGDFEFGNISINAGARVVRTEQTSKGLENGPDGTFTPIIVENNYTEVLPSVSVRYELRDDIVLRFTANRSITRPTLSKLAPARSLEPTQQLGSAGNPLLDPFIANQFDIGAEWYFGEESLLAVTFFYKDMESFIIDAEVPVVIQGSELKDANDKSINGLTFEIKQPINGQGGEVTGVELVYQQPFTFLPGPFDGFGIYANYTYSDSDVTAVVNGVPINTRLQGQSENSFNIIGYYENDIFNVRLAFSWRDDFVKELRQDREVKVFDYGQLDLTSKYNINDNASISFEALNLTDEISGVFDLEEFRPIETNVTGTTFRLGLLLRF